MACDKQERPKGTIVFAHRLIARMRRWKSLSEQVNRTAQARQPRRDLTFEGQMDPISNVDRLVLILRQKLSERAKLAGAKTGRKPSPQQRKTNDLDSIHALAAVKDVEDRQLKRALVQNILVDQFGPKMINDAKFQQVVSRVSEALDEDAATGALMTRIVEELRASAR